MSTCFNAIVGFMDGIKYRKTRVVVFGDSNVSMASHDGLRRLEHGKHVETLILALVIGVPIVLFILLKVLYWIFQERIDAFRFGSPPMSQPRPLEPFVSPAPTTATANTTPTNDNARTVKTSEPRAFGIAHLSA